MKTTRRDFLCLSAMACAWLLTGCQQPTVEERAVSWQPQQGSSGPASESGPMLNAALDDEAILREGMVNGTVDGWISDIGGVVFCAK